jgi:hypothetical protein
MAAAVGTRENPVVLQPRNSHEIAFLPSLDLAGIDQRIGSARLGTPPLGVVCRAAKSVFRSWTHRGLRRPGPPQGLGVEIVDTTRRFFNAMAMAGAIGFVATAGWIWLFG